jgi:hypothetical protein
MSRRALRIAPKLALIALRVVAAVLALGVAERAPLASAEQAHTASLAWVEAARLTAAADSTCASLETGRVCQGNGAWAAACDHFAALPAFSSVSIAPAIALSGPAFDAVTAHTPTGTTIALPEARGPPRLG